VIAIIISFWLNIALSGVKGTFGRFKWTNVLVYYWVVGSRGYYKTIAIYVGDLILESWR